MPSLNFPATGILDDFNRSNEGPPPGSNWSNLAELPGIRVQDDKAVGDIGEGYALWTGSQLGNSIGIEFYVDIVSNSPNIDDLELGRSASGVPPTYVLFTYSETGGYVTVIYRYIASFSPYVSEDFGSGVFQSSPPYKIGVRHLANGDYTVLYDAGSGWLVLFSGNYGQPIISPAGNFEIYVSNVTFDNFGGGGVPLFVNVSPDSSSYRAKGVRIYP